MRGSLRYRRSDSFVVFSFFLALQPQPLRDLTQGCHWVLPSLVLGLQSEQLHQFLSYCCDEKPGKGGKALFCSQFRGVQSIMVGELCDLGLWCQLVFFFSFFIQFGTLAHRTVCHPHCGWVPPPLSLSGNPFTDTASYIFCVSPNPIKLIMRMNCDSISGSCVLISPQQISFWVPNPDGAPNLLLAI